MKLIKGSNWLEIGDVKPVDWGHASDIRIDAPARTASANPATAKLETEIEILRKTLSETEARHQRELTAKVQQARQDAAAAHRRSDEEALAALSTSLGDATSEALDKLGAAERLALLLTFASLVVMLLCVSRSAFRFLRKALTFI